MNLDEITRLLQITLRGFCIHEKFIDELAYILRSSGIERSFFKKLEFCLRFLSLYGAQAVQHEEFESIGMCAYSTAFCMTNLLRYCWHSLNVRENERLIISLT